MPILPKLLGMRPVEPKFVQSILPLRRFIEPSQVGVKPLVRWLNPTQEKPLIVTRFLRNDGRNWERNHIRHVGFIEWNCPVCR